MKRPPPRSKRTYTLFPYTTRFRYDTDDNFDLGISDMVMPGRRSGLDLVQEIGERWPTLPTMLMTGYSDAAIAAARENISVLRKPYTIERLSTEIQATLRLREG